jgi:hypothetical protein
MAGVGKVPPAGAVLASVATGTVPGDESGCQVIGVPIDPQKASHVQYYTY